MRLRLFSTRNLVPLLALAAVALALLTPASAMASEADLVLPDLGDKSLYEFAGMSGWTLLTVGMLVAGLGILFGLVIYGQLKRLPVHRSMLEVSDLIYETCKTYLLTQGKFILILWACIAAVMVAYFGFLLARVRRTGKEPTNARPVQGGAQTLGWSTASGGLPLQRAC